MPQAQERAGAFVGEGLPEAEAAGGDGGAGADVDHGVAGIVSSGQGEALRKEVTLGRRAEGCSGVVGWAGSDS